MTNKHNSSPLRASPVSDRSKGNPTAPNRVTFLIVPRFNLIEMIALMEPMRVANYLSPAPL
jgi:transcriptional regulator GlxA family with amidase domain